MTLIEFVKIRATEQVAIINPLKTLRVDSCNSWAKKSVGQNYSVVFFAYKVIPPHTPFPTETPKNNSRFFLLKSCS